MCINFQIKIQNLEKKIHDLEKKLSVKFTENNHLKIELEKMVDIRCNLMKLTEEERSLLRAFWTADNHKENSVKRSHDWKSLQTIIDGVYALNPHLGLMALRLETCRIYNEKGNSIVVNALNKKRLKPIGFNVS